MGRGDAPTGERKTGLMRDPGYLLLRPGFRVCSTARFPDGTVTIADVGVEKAEK